MRIDYKMTENICTACGKEIHEPKGIFKHGSVFIAFLCENDTERVYQMLMNKR